jgi:hypothetical protein
VTIWSVDSAACTSNLDTCWLACQDDSRWLASSMLLCSVKRPNQAIAVGHHPLRFVGVEPDAGCGLFTWPKPIRSKRLGI